jgi:hypothetical protein
MNEATATRSFRVLLVAKDLKLIFVVSSRSNFRLKNSLASSLLRPAGIPWIQYIWYGALEERLEFVLGEFDIGD